jgi:hypothetical protein
MLTGSDYIRRLDVVNRGFRYVSALTTMRVGADTSQVVTTLARRSLYCLTSSHRQKRPRFVSWYDEEV